MSQSSLGGIQEGPAPVPPNVPATAEMVRNHGTATDAKIAMALAKAEYIRTCADTERSKLYERIITTQLAIRNQSREAAHEVLRLPAPPGDLLDIAKKVFTDHMTGDFPPISAPQILAHLQGVAPDLLRLPLSLLHLLWRLALRAPRLTRSECRAASIEYPADVIPDRPADLRKGRYACGNNGTITNSFAYTLSECL
jgi:hypothetical protein